MTQIIPTYTNNNGVRQRANVVTSDKAVILSDGRTLKDVVDESKEIKNGIENALDDMQSINVDEFSPVITQTTAIGKIGKDDNIDISANVNDGFFKSAILKGNTLVNLIDYSTVSPYAVKDGDTITVSAGENTDAWFGVSYKINNVSHGKTYIVMWDSLSYTHKASQGISNVIQISTKNSETNKDLKVAFTEDTNKKYLIFELQSHGTTKDASVRIIATTWSTGETGNTTTVKGLKVLEYQQCMENWGIPYFEGTQSVKMPVLTTCGKNLWGDYIWESWTNSSVTHNYAMKGFKPNTTYTVSATKITVPIGCYYRFAVGGIYLLTYDNRAGTTPYIATNLQKRITTNSNGELILGDFFNKKGNVSIFKQSVECLQLEESPVLTTYEQYKSNILTTPQDLELRGIGDVKDTLDLMTGEVTECIGEIVLDGSREWYVKHTSENTIRYGVIISDYKPNRNPNVPSIMCDKMPSKSNSEWNTDVEMIEGGWGTKEITIRLSKSKASSLEEFKAYLSQNPVTIQYELETPLIKTVVLSSVLLGFKDGHIMLSSGSDDYSLIPTLEYSVPVSKSAQITQNTATFARQSKQIYSLEILMMSASIEDAYRRLLLQNDVEVTRSINTNLEANPLRYYVLSKLIEENAYNVDDMLDKLDIFSLYNEITIDQYIELSDNVLGINEDIIEGEIIED